jgi:arylformamidase
VGKVLDLSRPVEPGMPHARTIPEPRFRAVRTVAEHGIRVLELTLPTHIGTHLDAPSHYLEDGTTVDVVPPETLVGRAYCAEVLRGSGEAVTAADLDAATTARGIRLERGDALLVRTGWDEHYGEDDYVTRHAYLAADAAAWAVDAGLRLVGVDTITPEYPMGLRTADYTPQAHHTLLGGGVLIIENLVLADVADRWLTLFVGALAVAGGDGAPARVLATLD